MGAAKNEMMRLEGLQSLGAGVLTRTGALKACDMHEEILINQEDPDAVSRAYAIGTNMVKAGEVDGSREELMDAIKSALADSYDECTRCAKWRNE